MKTRKLIFNLLLILSIVFASVFFTKYNAFADTEYEYIPTTNGTDLTYLNTNIKVQAPKTYTQKATEFRGVWVSFFAGDISGYNDSKDAFKERLLAVLNDMEKYNLNAIMFHLRTHNDALYDTKLAPKSTYITNADFKQWDYVEWFIEECHKRGIEFHAWLNPYRISSGKITMAQIKSKYSDYRDNPARDEENVLISTDTANPGAILDPGRPAVKEYLVDVCMEIIKKYDVDAIHFDDYFYMKGIDDSKTYQLYKSQYNNVNINDFRRLQIDDFIRDLSAEMYDYNIKNNKAVQLGISPSGVYRNGNYVKPSDYKYDDNGTLVSPLASNTGGYAHYDYPLYSDTKKWIDNEWIDYITPQLYGSFESKGCAYADAVDWWSAVVKYKKVNLYTGLGVYKSLIDSSDVGWYTKGNRTFEYILKYNQVQDQVDGFCLYQYRTLKNNVYNNPDLKYVFDNMLTNKAATPAIPRYSLDIEAPSNLKLVKGDGTVTLLFDSVNNASRYAIYKVEGTTSEIDVNNPNHLVKIVGINEVNSVIFDGDDVNYTYGIRAINQSNQFSELVEISGSQAQTEIDIPFAKFNDIQIIGSITSEGFFSIEFDKADVFIGKNVSYTIYSSLDQNEWKVEKEIKPLDGLKYNYRMQFNDFYHPVYYKIVMSNGFGSIESKIIKVDIKRIDVVEIFDYSLKQFNESMLNLFK